MNAYIDISDTVIKTDRLTLRPWKRSDLDDFFEYASVPGVGEAAGWTHHKTKEESKMILDMFIREKKTFAIEYEGKVIGSVGIELYSEDQMPELSDKAGREIGFVLSKDHWGRGLMPEAVRGVIKWLFDEVGLDFIECAHSPENLRSKRVQEKCGFRPYKNGTFTSYDGEQRETCRTILYKYEVQNGSQTDKSIKR